MPNYWGKAWKIARSRASCSQLIAALFALVTFVVPPAFPQVITGVAEGTLAPTFELKSLSNKSIRLSDYRGQIVVLNFWATWCSPCRRETPMLVELDKEYRKKGVAILGIDLDDFDAETISKFVAEHKISYPIVVGDDETSHEYVGLGGLPITFVIAPDGRVIKKFSGIANAAELEDSLKPLLSGSH
jgi:peroxiredoxin